MNTIHATSHHATSQPYTKYMYRSHIKIITTRSHNILVILNHIRMSASATSRLCHETPYKVPTCTCTSQVASTTSHRIYITPFHIYVTAHYLDDIHIMSQHTQQNRSSRLFYFFFFWGGGGGGLPRLILKERKKNTRITMYL